MLSWRNGKRSGLKIRRLLWLVGSSPTESTEKGGNMNTVPYTFSNDRTTGYVHVNAYCDEESQSNE